MSQTHVAAADAAAAASVVLPPLQRTDFEDRLRRLAVQFKLPAEGSTTVRRVDAAARRVLKGKEVTWHADILAKASQQDIMTVKGSVGSQSARM